MTIYLPDELAELVKAREDMNVSAVCQEALRAELDHRQELDKLAEKLERIVVYVEKPYGNDVAFRGTPVFEDERAEVTVYLTRQKRLAVYDGRRQTLDQFDTFDEFAMCSEEGDPEMVAAVAARLGKAHVVDLDI